MKKKYIVSTREVHACDYEVFAESVEEAKQKVMDDEATPLPQDDPYCYRLETDEWEVRVSAPISSIKFSKGGRA